jgi:tripartite-type tricarboxylate transporter receptor subunit TctC
VIVAPFRRTLAPARQKRNWRDGIAQERNGMKRPSLRFAALALAVALSTVGAVAQDIFPTRTVRLIVPAAGGSTTDTLARLLADQLARRWGKPVVVENISGGGMVVGATQAFRSAPDGYALMVSPPAPITFNHLLYHDLAYDPRQFVPVALLARIANALAVRQDFPATNVAELIAFARGNPGRLTYGSQGAGSTAHLSAAELEVMAGIAMVHVPYRGAVPALNDVLAGHIDMFFDTVATAVPMYRGGKIRILAVGSAERAAVAPEIPTMEEAGLPGFRSVTWFTVVAPPGMPAQLAAAINHDVADALSQSEVQDRLGRIGLEPMIGTPDDAARFFAAETRLWGKVIAAANIKAE